MRISSLLTLALLAACNGGGEGETKCKDEDKIDVFVDDDGDGYGTGPARQACAAESGLVTEDGDCADDDNRVNPGSEERCNGTDDDCDNAIDDGLKGKVFFLDDDGDGFGNHDDALTACAAPDGRVLDDTDCDDTSSGINPGMVEVCDPDDFDEDCDGVVDDEDDSTDPASKTPFYADTDADGFGDPDLSRSSCAAPAGAADNGDDCDDGRAEVNPAAPEICDLRDDDCDGLLDHLDDSIDPALLLPGFEDADSDGHGDATQPIQTCGYRPGIAAQDGDDCDDTVAAIHPGARERSCDTIDNDCDAATVDNPDADADGTRECDGDCNDVDDTVHPGAAETIADGIDSDCDGGEDCYGDADGDGLRNDTITHGVTDPRCRTGANRAPDVAVDCDDTDAAIDWSGDWLADGDGDNYGAGAAVVVGDCTDQGAGFAPVDRAADCDDVDPTVNPGALEICADGLDANCDGRDTCATCADILAGDPLSPSDTYTLEPLAGLLYDVWCDMDTDGGGWTLVGASAGVYYSLDNLNYPYTAYLADPPNGALSYTAGLWDGLGHTVQGDMRFTCSQTLGGANDVDLSFYDTSWYDDLVDTPRYTGSCFNAGGSTDFPARRNNLTGDELPAGDAYTSGTITGEDLCGDFGDFTVDFDDAGMNGDESDGTDWGNDDYTIKCGDAGLGAQFYVFVR